MKEGKDFLENWFSEQPLLHPFAYTIFNFSKSLFFAKAL